MQGEVLSQTVMLFLLEHSSILVVYNQSGCEASLVNKTKAQEIVQSLKASQLKRCDALKEMRVEIRSIKGTKEFSREGKEQGATYNLERGFKPIFKVYHLLPQTF